MVARSCRPAPVLLAALLLSLAAHAGCSAFRLPAEDDPDRSRHSYEIEGEVRRAGTNAVVPGAALEVTGAKEVAGDKVTDATGRFWLHVSGISGGKADPAGIGTGPAGMVVLKATAKGLCSTEIKVLLPASGPVSVTVAPCK
jgi:hypothetical protein